MTWPKKLELRGWAPKLDGVGERLTLRFKGSRGNSAGGDDTFRGDVMVTVDRWFVRQLCVAIAEMQIADRARIAEELARLDMEVLAVQIKKPTT